MKLTGYFDENPSNNIDREYLLSAVVHAENKMTDHLDTHPECKNMASTLTLLYMGSNSAIIDWAGDSRVYHVRNGEILFQTRDHSCVNQLVKQGEITEEEARTHPRRNQILRAVKGSEEPTRIDTKEISDIRNDDYFFLCTDGILENIDDNTL